MSSFDFAKRYGLFYSSVESSNSYKNNYSKLIKNDESIGRKIVLFDNFRILCEKYGMPTISKDWNDVYVSTHDLFPYPWDGHALSIPSSIPSLGSRTYPPLSLLDIVETLCHELAHWIVASEDERLLSDFGMPFGKEFAELSEEKKLFFQAKEDKVNVWTRNLLCQVGTID